MVISVLLADDHGVLRDGVKRLLEASGDIRVTATAANGADAVARAAKVKPDVALVDISLPLISGIEVTRSIAKSMPTTAVVILSMHSSVDLIHEALRAGARGYLIKDSAGDEVIKAVRTVAAGGRFFGDGVAGALADGWVHGRSAAEHLTPRDRDILRLVAAGKSNSEAAAILGLSPRSVETYRLRLMEKLGLDDLPALVKFAIRHGLATLE
jgi:DNA-binding NarL/FixJ family response regulator